MKRRRCSFVTKQPVSQNTNEDDAFLPQLTTASDVIEWIQLFCHILSVQLWTPSWKFSEAAAMKQSQILLEIPSIPAAYGLRPTFHLPCHPSFYLILHQTTSTPPTSNLFLLRKAGSMKVITTRWTAKLQSHTASPFPSWLSVEDDTHIQTLLPQSWLPRRSSGGRTLPRREVGGSGWLDGLFRY